MKTILCITDFSPAAENAVNYAYELAQVLQCRLLLFHAVAETAAASGAPSHAHLTTALDDRHEHLHRLKETRRRLTYDSTGNVPLEVLVQQGPTQKKVPALVREEEVELVIVGNEDATTLQEVFRGTVAAEVIERTPCPVLVVPRQATFNPLQKIVFAVDQLGEPYQDAGLVHRLANVFKAEVLVLHVLPEGHAGVNATGQEEVYPLASWQTYRDIAYHVLLNPNIEAGISQFTREHRVDLLVLGYHDENPWHHLRTPSQEQDRAYHTFLPVLFAHYKQHHPAH